MSIKVHYLSKFCRYAPAMLDTLKVNLTGRVSSEPSRYEWQKMLVKPFISGGGFLYAVECSLPRLLFGHNGRLISNQAEFDAAIHKLFNVVSDLAETPPLDTWQPRRLDLVWQYSVPDAGALIDALSGLSHPAVRAPSIHQAGRVATWRGAGSRFMIQAYNKSLKMRQEGNVMRLEIRLSGEAIKFLRGRDWRSFSELYVAYREILSQFEDLTLMREKCGWPEAVGRAVPEIYHEAVLANLDREDRSKRDLRLRIRTAKIVSGEGFSWSDLLPPNQPPEAVTVEPKQRKRK